jgi:hypothetical protein
MMLGKSSLRKTDGTWTFRDETTLEDFVWEHLSQLFGLTRLKRQFTIDSLTKEEICDILAIAPDGGLVILESDTPSKAGGLMNWIASKAIIGGNGSP